MKKFLSKMPVMVTFLAVAVVLLGVYIFMLARPVSYGMNYKQEYDAKDALSFIDAEEGQFKKLDVAQYAKFKNGKVVTVSMHVDYKFNSKVDGTVKALLETTIKRINEAKPTEYYYLRSGNKIVLVGTNKEEYKAEKELVDKMSKKEKEAYFKEEYSFEVNAFTAKSRSYEGEKAETMICAGEIVWAVVLGVVEVALIAFSALSVVYFVGSKKKHA